MRVPQKEDQMNRPFRVVLPFAAAMMVAGSAFAYPATVEIDLNLRSGPSTADAVIDVMPAGSVVDVGAPLANGWCPVDYRGLEGFASCSYLGGPTGSVRIVRAPAYYYDDYYGYPAGVSLYLYGGRPFYWNDGRRVFVRKRIDRDRDDRDHERRLIVRERGDDRWDDRRGIRRMDRGDEDDFDGRRVRMPRGGNDRLQIGEARRERPDSFRTQPQGNDFTGAIGRSGGDGEMRFRRGGGGDRGDRN
jgi:uncharacterized protein YraI